ncbi:hypothetical protein KP509_22G031100 [Ceratopteris richardii]|uniref:Uncharacterized protein n=1 Tax=Ceratopteris richardii TaxID=49495 RepID=A0A8T2S6E5_CERRI|nr:hypothetical protein KP509_22G031100 [Ceratopteris richardii]
MTWSFFGVGHGKGEHDGAGACNAFDVVQFCREKLSDGVVGTYASRVREFHRIFWEVTTDACQWDCHPIENSRYEGHHDFLSDALVVGNNFVVPTEDLNEEQDEFYILQCVRLKSQVTSMKTYQWGNIIDIGTYDVEGLYYRKVFDDVYELLRMSPIVMIYTHLPR